MVTVHHLENSRSQRILWLLEELGIEYEIKHYKRDPKTNLAPAELKVVHPLGKSPVITDEINGEKVVVAESGAIVEYLLEQYGPQFLPADDIDSRNRYRYWLHFAEGSITAALVTKLIFDKTTQPPVPFFIRPVTKAVADKVGKGYLNPTITAQLQYMDKALAETGWFGGEELTGADFMMIFPCESTVANGVARQYPNIVAYAKKIQARPAYKAGLKKGGPYDFSL